MNRLPFNLSLFCYFLLCMATGHYHTITLADDGRVYSFGENDDGQLGLGNNESVDLPTPILVLPEITQICCGAFFTICVDVEGIMWSFGKNNFGQLGTGNTLRYNTPKKIEGIPPVLSVACGYEHTLIIMKDDNLWSCGSNTDGQLCLEYQQKKHIPQQSKPQKTSFSNISKISAGYYHSLFQNTAGEIYACGKNDHGALGLGHFNNVQIIPTLIPNQPLNIVQFVCGCDTSLFLDSSGNVYSVGFNFYGCLGLGHTDDQNVLNQIPNIPPIHAISSVRDTCMLIDFEGNVWGFGDNTNGMLALGELKAKTVPTKSNYLENIQQISCGPCGSHFLVKDSNNKIFALGFDKHNLGTVFSDPSRFSTPKEINSKYFTIWRNNVANCKAKSARK